MTIKIETNVYKILTLCAMSAFMLGNPSFGAERSYEKLSESRIKKGCTSPCPPAMQQLIMWEDSKSAYTRTVIALLL